MAAIQQAEFLGDLINKIYSILNNIEYLEREKEKFNLVHEKNL